MNRAQRKRFLGLAAAAVAFAGVSAGVSSTAGAQTTVGSFSGADPGEGLDLQGNFVYAVDPGGPGGQVGDANFVNENAAPGFTLVSEHSIAAGGWADVEYGSGQEDTLETIVESIRWDQAENPPGSGVGVIPMTFANLVPGTQYKLQLMIQENDCCTGRGMDVFVEGAEIVSDYATNVTLPEIEPGGTSARTGLITHEFTAGDDTLEVELRGGGPFGDNNPIINGVTLELVPEPGALSLLALAAPALLRRRRR